MTHLTEEDLVLYRYQEAPDAGSIARHLADCEPCQAAYAELGRVLGLLDARVPEPPPAYERDVWAGVQARLAATPTAPRFSLAGLWPQLALAAMIALLLAGSFAIDRAVRPAPEDPVVGVAKQDEGRSVRDRVLLAAVGEHLQRSDLMLTEFKNAEARGAIDLSEQAAWAEDLVSENRLYRQGAAGAGDAQTLSLLEDLERVLLEVAHAPASADARELDRLRTRLETQDVLFKVRVAGAGLRAREDVTSTGQSPSSDTTGSGL